MSARKNDLSMPGDRDYKLPDGVPIGLQGSTEGGKERPAGAAADATAAGRDSQMFEVILDCAEDDVQRLLAVVRTLPTKTNWGTMQVIAIAHMLTTLRSVLEVKEALHGRT